MPFTANAAVGAENHPYPINSRTGIGDWAIDRHDRHDHFTNITSKFGVCEKPSKIRRMSKPATSTEILSKHSIKSIAQPPPPTTSLPSSLLPAQHLFQEPSIKLENFDTSPGLQTPSREPSYHPRPAVHLTSLAMDNSAPISIFGIGREHPFGNYWTSSGGLAEVVAVLPSKQQADILMAKFFEIVDPMYPVIDRYEIMSGYHHFWSLQEEKRSQYDSASIALQFVIYANATLFIEHGQPTERARTAEFYSEFCNAGVRPSS
ncbi:MAG: hypothetical protein Q9162_002632 [Coniocarpon cinnabarinum]